MNFTKKVIITQRFKQQISAQMQPLSRWLARSSVQPNMITLISLFFAFCAGTCCALGKLQLSIPFFILSAISDILDGQIARERNCTNAFGALLDSTVDRYNESIILIGITINFLVKDDVFIIILILIALIGSLTVSYVKARAEGLGYDCKVGMIQRAERLILLGIGLLLGKWTLIFALLLLAILSHLTVIQRLLYVRGIYNKNENEK